MKVININDDVYPDILKSIKNPPKKLYIEGNIDLLKDKAIAVIGSRECSNYGERWCEKFVKQLLEYGLTIVSGMAKGIDTIAHKTTLKYGGKTIAVLPSGFDNIYPKENKKLYSDIINSKGMIISEYEPNLRANSKTFLERNRIVSGLSMGILVVEAEYRSGTSVTARIAKEQERDVFCIPGSLDNRKSIGTNNLIKKGAKIVTSVDDIINNYSGLNKIELAQKEELNVNSQYKDIYDLISDIPIDLNEIIKKNYFNVNEVMSKITMLELDGKVKKLAGNKFIRI